MVTIGLVGGIACGKSTVAKLLAQHGAKVLDADAAAHQVLDSAGVRQAIVDRWGAGVVDQSGQVDRAEIAKRVFGGDAAARGEREFLESIVHPCVKEQLFRQRTEAFAAGAQVVVLDVPLLLEAGWGEECDLVLFIDSAEEDRIARAAARGWERGELAQREHAQLPIEEKAQAADSVVSNNGDLSELRVQVDRFWRDSVLARLESPGP